VLLHLLHLRLLLGAGLRRGRLFVLLLLLLLQRLLLLLFQRLLLLLLLLRSWAV